MEHGGDGDTNFNWCAWNNPQRIGRETGRLGNKRTIQTTALLRSARILRRVLVTCYHSNSSEKKSSANAGVKNSQRSKITKMMTMMIMINLWDLEIQTDHPIPDKRPDLVLINKKKRTCHLKDFAVPPDH